ncbi:MAG: hypothetical protein PVF28_03640 [Thioalkalispiraceae bacterium]|jgi:hypothetical protein
MAMEDQLNTTRAVLRASSNELLKKSNVVATGVGYKVTAGKQTDQLCLICSVQKKLPRAQLSEKDLVSPQLQGLPTDVVETGLIRAFQNRTDRFRPAPGGVSIGHYLITAGTLGCLVNKNGKRMILSNNHVLANSNDANIGDPIYQPGPIDGGSAADQIATLEDFVPIDFGEAGSSCSIGNSAAGIANLFAQAVGSKTRLKAVQLQATDNLVDAAIARPLSDSDVEDSILDIGAIAGVGEASLNMSIQKSGRTTGYTTGVIQQVDVTADVNYGGSKTARFTDQLLAGPMSQGGDSGSAVLDDDNNLVGLLFAGSETTTIINRIQHVFNLLQVSR